MQVTHLAETVTHAVIGRAKTQDLDIVADAAMMNMLSNALYSHKDLAVVREVLCNAWDEHIKAGITNVPVQVTLSDDKMIIRDSGTGIHPGMMQPIYGRYGASTKKKDGTVTGGFGLGSKAPFAKVDHFEVTSWIDGKKTIYAISKSSAEVEGKPGITPLVTVPCDHSQHQNRTGLAVSVDIDRYSTYETLVREIAMLGEMNVELNGTQLKTIPFSTFPHGFVMLHGQNFTAVPNWSTNKIFVRYGNVVYPIASADGYNLLYNRVLKELDSIGGISYYHRKAYNLILQAEPDTISVTPSRESLSMNDLTTRTITGLLEAFLTVPSKGNQFAKYCFELEKELVLATVKKDPVQLIEHPHKIPTAISQHTHTNMIVDAKGMAHASMHASYPSIHGFARKDMLLRLKNLEAVGFGGTKNRGRLQTFRTEYLRSQTKLGRTKRSSDQPSSWFKRRVVMPLIKAMEADDTISANKLMVYGQHTDNDLVRNRYSYREIMSVQAMKLSPRKLIEYLPFLRNIVVIHFNRSDIVDRLPYISAMKALGQPTDIFTYQVSRTTGKNTAAVKFFENQGMTVIDLTKRWDNETPEVVQVKPKPVNVKPRKKGIPRLDQIVRGDTFNHKLLTGSDLEAMVRVETPEFIVQLNPKADSGDNAQIISNLGLDLQRRFAKLYGEKGGITLNYNQYFRFTNELKIPDVSDWLITKIEDFVLNNAKAQSALSFDVQRNNTSHFLLRTSDQIALFEIIVDNPELAIEFDILNELNQEEQFLLDAFNQMSQSYWHQRKDNIKKLVAHAVAIPPSQELMNLAERIRNADLVGLLDTSFLSKIFKKDTNQKDKDLRKSAMDIITYALDV